MRQTDILTYFLCLELLFTARGDSKTPVAGERKQVIEMAMIWRYSKAITKVH